MVFAHDFQSQQKFPPSSFLHFSPSRKRKGREGEVFQFCYQAESTIPKWKINTNVLQEKTKTKNIFSNFIRIVSEFARFMIIFLHYYDI